jgi:hypothetical protein
MQKGDGYFPSPFVMLRRSMTEKIQMLSMT